MPYFSRLTDIVTCNLSSLLEGSENPQATLTEIIHEMTEGVAGAERSVKTAINNVGRIETEIGEQRIAVGEWLGRAQSFLRDSDELQARAALERKQEVEDLIAGLEQQLQAAVATRDHLQTLWQALQARLSDARRRLDDLHCTEQPASAGSAVAAPAVLQPVQNTRQTRVDMELEELKRQLQAE